MNCKLEIGAGINTKSGWISTDLYPKNGIIHLDVTKKFPFEDNSFDFIYSEHMIEHLSLVTGQFMLNECFRVLKLNGTIRIVTPDLEFLLRICSPMRNQLEQEYFEWSINKFVPNAPITQAVFIDNFMRNWGHSFIYDMDTLVFALKNAGFSNIIECKINKSNHGDLRNLENIKRLPKNFLELESIIVEANKI